MVSDDGLAGLALALIVTVVGGIAAAILTGRTTGDEVKKRARRAAPGSGGGSKLLLFGGGGGSEPRPQRSIFVLDPNPDAGTTAPDPASQDPPAPSADSGGSGEPADESTTDGFVDHLRDEGVTKVRASGLDPDDNQPSEVQIVERTPESQEEFEAAVEKHQDTAQFISL